MAREDETALMLLNEKQGSQLAETRKENAALKKGMNPLGMIGIGGVAAVTGAAIGFGEGMKTAGDPAKEQAIKGVAPAVALVVGGAGAALAGANNPKARAAAAGVAIAGAALLGRDVGHSEGVAMALQGMADRAAKGPPAPAPQGGIQGGYRGK